MTYASKKANDPIGHSPHFSALLVRPTPYFDESEHGYRLRLANDNGISIPDWLGNVHSPTNQKPASGHARWCPACLKGERPYWRKSWENGPAICIQHQCWLVDICVGCNRTMSWRNSRLLTCSCGHSLLDSHSEKFSDQVVSLISGVDVFGTSPWWREISFERRWKIAYFLGALHAYGLRGKPLKKASHAAIIAERAVMNAGAEILVGGELEFRNLLNRIRIQPVSSVSVQLMREAFPGLLIRMRRQLTRSECAIFFQYMLSALNTNVASDVIVIWKGKNDGVR